MKIIKMDVPTHKLVGESVKLVCRFEMEGDTLYSVKWYRNEQEFYRLVSSHLHSGALQSGPISW